MFINRIFVLLTWDNRYAGKEGLWGGGGGGERNVLVFCNRRLAVVNLFFSF